MKTLVIASLLAAAVPFAPTSTAGPDCIQAYPWSKVCEGELPIAVNCITMSPFWEICNGNVPGVVAWAKDQVLP